MPKTGNSETHLAVDEKLKMGYTRTAMNEGFASASGVRPETAESGGKVTKGEDKDRARFTGRVSNGIDGMENGGAAD